MPKINCAIYTRKSTEHGLDMEFNSLQNQEEACKAYILSQAFNGWQYYKTYSDGGISGGTMERPGLKGMLADIRARKIQVVVVYKVDRLSRSIIDFHKMMREFDKYGCNFVSITQSFDTSNSMGKLTLNMLLSFAQFEREVSAERVRDKISATKAKGMWTGGIPSLGYDIRDKRLIVNKEEANTVNLIFKKYLELGTLEELRQWLYNNNIRTKCWQTKKGLIRGTKPFEISTLHRLLRNPLYIGKIIHCARGKIYQGQHEAIVETSLFEQVQVLLARHWQEIKQRYRSKRGLLSGILFDNQGIAYKMTSSSKGVRRFKYYFIKGGAYIPAQQLDNFVSDIMRREGIAEGLNKVACERSGKEYHIKIYIDKAKAAEGKKYFESDGNIIIEDRCYRDNVSSVSLGGSERGKVLNIREISDSLIRGLSLGWQYKKALFEGLSQREMAQRFKRDIRTIKRYIYLSYLSPKIVGDILEYKNPFGKTLREMLDLAEQEKDFNKQEGYWFGRTDQGKRALGEKG